MSPLEEELRSPLAIAVVSVLARYVSQPIARSVVRMAARRAGLSLAKLEQREGRQLGAELEVGLELFLRETSQRRRCLSELAALWSQSELGRTTVSEGRRRIEVRTELDVVMARNDARTMARRQGFSEAGRTRVATAVSELARNIVRYAGSGELELRPSVTEPAGLELTATDRGPGIADLAAVLEGRHRSALGMGLGLRGVKSIATRFAVDTGPGKGTCVTVFLEKS